ncbi:hypothetical protein EXN61_11440 [Agrobacterium tumefaciens]|uniref:Uncharacterized protein n=2 Tax=Agrobacterium tumefaciens TaxID=358 RepID=A0A546XYL2_AGRTU|nr:hypothetical protein EXN61_11440 [Agrobacterium tumefaciens]
MMPSAFSTTNTQEEAEREAYIEALNKRAASNFRKIKFIEFATLVLVTCTLMLAISLASESYLKADALVNQERTAAWK